MYGPSKRGLEQATKIARLTAERDAALAALREVLREHGYLVMAEEHLPDGPRGYAVRTALALLADAAQKRGT